MLGLEVEGKYSWREDLVPNQLQHYSYKMVLLVIQYCDIMVMLLYVFHYHGYFKSIHDFWNELFNLILTCVYGLCKAVGKKPYESMHF